MRIGLGRIRCTTYYHLVWMVRLERTTATCHHAALYHLGDIQILNASDRIRTYSGLIYVLFSLRLVFHSRVYHFHHACIFDVFNFGKNILTCQIVKSSSTWEPHQVYPYHVVSFKREKPTLHYNPFKINEVLLTTASLSASAHTTLGWMRNSFRVSQPHITLCHLLRWCR